MIDDDECVVHFLLFSHWNQINSTIFQICVYWSVRRT